jgi:folate-binding protein YgfZ
LAAKSPIVHPEPKSPDDPSPMSRLYGPEEAGVQVVETFGHLELEYAPIRKAAALFDLPQRAVIEARGSEALDFLSRMLTQSLEDLPPLSTRRSFWLNRKGRIDADLSVVRLEDRLLLDSDIHAAARTVETLSAFLFAEDVELTDLTSSTHRLALHGPGSARALGSISEPIVGPSVAELPEGGACVIRVAGAEVTVFRWDWLGEIGMELIADAGSTAEVYRALADHDGVSQSAWHAMNLARVEAGSPLYYLDFGPDALPHETGVLNDRVSFQKGCFLGQEVVARMQSLGHPKQRLVALRLDRPEDLPDDAPLPQPVGGAPVHAPGDEGGKVLGVVTSSAISPMLGAEPILFAMVKHASSSPGTKLALSAEGRPMTATVQPKLRFWP